MRYPFTLYKVKSTNGIMWHARLWDETLQRYAHSRTTGVLVEGKREQRREAEDTARKLYDEFIAAQSSLPPPQPSQAIPTAPQPTILAPLIPQAAPAVPTIKTVANTSLIDYLSNFWTPESEYARFKKDVKNKALTPYYIEMNHEDVRRHVEPFPGFEGVTVGTLTKAILKKWMIWLAGRRKTRTKKDGTIIDEGTISGRRANAVLQAVRVAVQHNYIDGEGVKLPKYNSVRKVPITSAVQKLLVCFPKLQLPCIQGLSSPVPFL